MTLLAVADRDPDFHSDAKPNPASQNEAAPCGSGFATLSIDDITGITGVKGRSMKQGLNVKECLHELELREVVGMKGYSTSQNQEFERNVFFNKIINIFITLTLVSRKGNDFRDIELD